jgi:hypothetical protein
MTSGAVARIPKMIPNFRKSRMMSTSSRSSARSARAYLSDGHGLPPGRE